jgi:hypothetical protein
MLTLKKLKSLLTLCVILWAFGPTCKSQGFQRYVAPNGDTMVSMPVKQYRFAKQRNKEADRLELQCDSARTKALGIFKTKDSIIAVQDQTRILKDSIISGKNETIRALAAIQKPPKTPKLTIPLIAVSVGEFFLLILAIK